jgi:large subunit ribosomal protein L9
MRIILLKDTPKVGRKYDVKDVADGYALNMLIPRGFAVAATASAVKNIETMKANDATDKRIQEELLAKNLETIKNLTLTISEKANDKGHLFAGITKERLVAEIAKATRLNIGPELVKLDKPLKESGEHRVNIEALGKKAEFTVKIN